MEEYFAAKRLLFAGAGAPSATFAVLNPTTSTGARLAAAAGTEVLWYGSARTRPFARATSPRVSRACASTCSTDRTRFPVESALMGSINVYNILAACATGLSYGLSLETIARGIADCRAVPGRFERVDEGQPFLVVVDYAHTDDALRTSSRWRASLNRPAG